MDDMETKSVDPIKDDVSKSTNISTNKIALMPFAEAGCGVHVLDADGKRFPVRERSAEEDFRLAVQSLGAPVSTDDEDKGDGGGEKRESGGDGGDSTEHGASFEGNGTAGEGKDVTDVESGSAADKQSSSPAEHPLQKAVTSFDMALGELNQLIHLIDLARAGEFMALERVTPRGEDQGRTVADQSAGARDEAPRNLLAEMVNLKSNQLKGAADQLRQRAKWLRQTTVVQQVFQQGVVHLRKNWRIIAPNHGKVDVPLQVGEALAVDCSFGSAGGRPVPSTQTAGTRHRHPWLFQFVSGKAGKLEAGSQQRECLQTFEIQLVSALTGRCESSLRTSFPARCCSRERERVKTTDEVRTQPVVKTETDKCDANQVVVNDLERLEQGIARVHHSVFWEEVFESIKAESLVAGRNGWLAHHDERSDSASAATHSAPKVDGEMTGAGTGIKRRLVNGTARGTLAGVQASGMPVVHVMDNEVMVRMDNEYLLGYKIVPDGDGSEVVSNPRRDKPSCAPDRSHADAHMLRELKEQRTTSLCRLALLYGGSLLRQHQQNRAHLANNAESKLAGAGGDGKRALGGSSATGGSNAVLAGRAWTKGRLWGSVGCVLRHQRFCKQVVRVLADISLGLRTIGLPLTVQWTHLEATYPCSSLNITLGNCFHFRVSLDDESKAVVSALPGLENHADQRLVELFSAVDVRKFLLGEVCRQIVLTFGDMASTWIRNIHPKTNCFKVDLTPTIIHLFEAPKTGLEGGSYDEGDRRWDVGVSAETEVGVQIACSRWSKASSMPNGRDAASHESAIGSLPLKRDMDRDISVEEWEKLEGRDLFEKFATLLEALYPPRQTSWP